ncbi:hypothetical protein A6F49_04315 [Enteractinococcus helveticum]|uniref:Uncharacterized protein n=2 Tax=Enteractinococcus helveticum TaxID=1837282 RepID=A0A1B7M2Q7_9MICC|nr:hypothetical protein A6F49_04315 [Enteractinococcus helveticum]
MPTPLCLAEDMKQPFTKQRAFSYDREKWLHWLAEIPGAVTAVTALPNEVDRDAIKHAVKENLEANNVEGAFSSTMIWGYGTIGYGPSRTLKILSNGQENGNTLSDAVVNKLRQSVKVSRTDGGVAGFYYLNNEGKIKDLGPSFFTKWLYFITASGPQGEKAATPILDALVIDWLEEKGMKLRRARSSDYENYVCCLTEWGAPYGLSAAEVEERIFRIIRGGTN